MKHEDIIKSQWQGVLICSIVSLLTTTLIVFVVFAIRTIIDPMTRNPEVIYQTKRIFYLFLMPYYAIENSFIGLNPDFSHRFHALWTPIGILLTILYISIAGNLIRLIYLLFSRKKKQ